MSDSKKIRIVSTGFAKQAIADAAKKSGGDLVEIEINSDMAGARKVKNGEADYYIGSCWSGQGGALSIAIGVLGYSNCAMVTTASGHPTPEQIKSRVNEKDWKAFGINAAHAASAVPHIIDALLEKNGLK
ncbi:DUF2620 family protein [Bacillus canaveralius]|uniref:DUF2620 family protein n=1 Tax=Bacillus canaveralius TaxID=1403243 RepID=UPI001158475E|nr:DUF2620 family protein [Bacillus canaveralius]